MLSGTIWPEQQAAQQAHGQMVVRATKDDAAAEQVQEQSNCSEEEAWYHQKKSMALSVVLRGKSTPRPHAPC